MRAMRKKYLSVAFSDTFCETGGMSAIPSMNTFSVEDLGRLWGLFGSYTGETLKFRKGKKRLLEMNIFHDARCPKEWSPVGLDRSPIW